jgi:acetolactate synthase I/II/III large subunit
LGASTACTSADSGADAIVRALAEAGARWLFGVPGGGPNLDVVGAAATAGLRFILAHGETAAVIMAATCADLTGTPGAVVVTRGPGLASAVNGIAHASLDRLPVVVIADTVAAADASRVSHQRIDQAGLGRSVAKAAITVGRPRGEVAARIVRTALAAPPGPVIANMDDSTGNPGPDDAPECGAPVDSRSPAEAGASLLARALRTARRPVLLLGTGASPQTAALRAALAGRGIPALHTYRARGVIPDSAAEAAGLVTGGTMEWPLLAAADLIVGFGVDEAEMIPAPWDYAARTILITESAASPPPGYRGYFTGATAVRMPLARAAEVLAEVLAEEPGHDWPPDAGRAAKTDAAARLMAAATASPGLLALRRPGPTVIDASVDPAGYLAVMDLSRGQAGRRSVPGVSRALGVTCP